MFLGIGTGSRGSSRRGLIHHMTGRWLIAGLARRPALEIMSFWETQNVAVGAHGCKMGMQQQLGRHGKPGRRRKSAILVPFHSRGQTTCTRRLNGHNLSAVSYSLSLFLTSEEQLQVEDRVSRDHD